MRPARASRGAIIYLATHDDYLKKVEQSLHSMQSHYFGIHGVSPVIVFVSDEASEEAKRSLLTVRLMSTSMST